jgi:orotidine-5'-phosphate decarboxylase
MTPTCERLIVALDVSSSAAAQEIVSTLGDAVQVYKVGTQLYTAQGPQVVRDLIASGRKVFLDLKYHDIPNTVAAAVREAAQLGVSMLTLHALGGTKMLNAGVEAARGSKSLRVLAVTVLTSMEQADLNEIGIPGSVEQQVSSLALLALKSGCSGVVTSAREIRALRASQGNNFLVVTPGIRPAGSALGDQARVVTPSEAMAAGATHIVVGRPITAAADPAGEAEKILREIA